MKQYHLSADCKFNEPALSLLKKLGDLAAGEFTITDVTPKPPAIVVLRVLPARNSSGDVSAIATCDEEVLATATTPSAKRSLAALGWNSPEAHKHQLYRKRFGNNYKLELAKDAATTGHFND